MAFVKLRPAGGHLTATRRISYYVYGRWQVTIPDDIEKVKPDHLNEPIVYPPGATEDEKRALDLQREIELEDWDDRLTDGYIALTTDEELGRFDFGFVRADASMDMNTGASDVEQQIETGIRRSEGDIFFQADVEGAGLGRFEFGKDYDVGDDVDARQWGLDIPTFVTSATEMPSGLRVHLGGQLAHDAAALRSHNTGIEAQLLADRKKNNQALNAVRSTASKAALDAAKAVSTAEDAEKKIDEVLENIPDPRLFETYIEESRAAVASASDFAAQAIAAADEAEALNVEMADKIATVSGYVADVAGHVADAQASAEQTFSYLEESRRIRDNAQAYAEESRDAATQAQASVGRADEIMDEADQVLSSTRQFRDQAQTAMSGARTALNDAKGTLEQVVAKHGEVLTWHQDVLTAHGETLAVHETVLRLHSSGIRAANAAAGQAASAAAANSMVLQVHGQILEVHEDAIATATQTASDAAAAANGAATAVKAVAAAQEIQVEINSRLAAGVRAAGVAAAQAAAATSSLALAVEEVDRAASFAQQTADDAKAVGEKATQIANDAKTASAAAIAAGNARDQTIRDTSDLAALSNFRRTRFWFSGDFPSGSAVSINDTLRFDDGTVILTITGDNTGFNIATTGNFSGKIAFYLMTRKSFFGSGFLDVPLGTASNQRFNHSDQTDLIQRLYVHVFPEWPSQAVKDKYTSIQMPYRK